MNTCRVALCWALFALVAHTALVVPTTEARTIQITSGVFTAIGSFGGASGTLIGDGFSFSGGGRSMGGVNPLCAPCRPGDLLSLRTVYSGSDLIGAGTIDGVPTNFGSLALIQPSLFVEFNGSLVVPPAPSSTADVAVDAPFSFTGRVDFLTGAEDLDLAGQGTAHVLLTPINTGTPFVWTLRETDFVFSPVPEPGTLALVTGGVLLAIARVVRRRQD